VKEKKKRITTGTEEDDDENDIPIRLAQMIKSMSVDIGDVSNDDNNEENENNETYNVRYSFRLIEVVFITKCILIL